MKYLLRKILKIRETGVLAALALIIAVTAIFNHRFFSEMNLQILSRQIAVLGIIAIGETFVIITKGIDLSPGAMVAMTCVLVAWFMTHALGIVGAIIMILIVSAIVGMWHGFYVSKLGIPPFIITLCTFLIARAVGSVIKKSGPINLPPSFSSFSYLWYGVVFRVPVPVLILVMVAGISIFILRYTPLGRHIYAVGGSIEAARLSGINVDRTRIIVYTISTILSGVAGILHAAWLNQGNVNVAQLYELYAIAATVIGGTSLFGGVGTVQGTIIGAAILRTIWNSMVLLKISAYWQNVVLGGVIIAAVTIDTLRKRGERR
ncbi:ABC transporter permease [Candidatus Poribacteria bacterium]